jgi:putative tricarboxylic transport membrane protein
MIRAPKDFWSGSMFLVVGVGAMVLARGYPMGTATRMGPAYFPTVLGGLLAVIGLAVLVRSLVVPGPRITAFAGTPLLYVTVATVIFGALVRGGGLVPSLIILAVLSAWASRHFTWRAALPLAVGLTIFSALVFVKALGLPMPLIGAWLGG